MASTVQRLNFELKSDMLKVQRRDFPLSDTTLCNPLNASALVDGEWMTLNTTTGKAERAADITQAAGTVASSKRPLVLWAERGRSDVQGLSSKKVPLLFLGDWEADTRIYDASLGATITTIGQPLKVAVVSLVDTNGTTRKYSGLMAHGGVGDNDPVVGYVTKLPVAANNYRLRFMATARTFG